MHSSEIAKNRFSRCLTDIDHGIILPILTENAELNISTPSDSHVTLVWQVLIIFAWQMHLSVERKCGGALFSFFAWWNFLRVGIKINTSSYTQFSYAKWTWCGIADSATFDNCIRHAKMIQTCQRSCWWNLPGAKIFNSAFSARIRVEYHGWCTLGCD